MVCDDYFSGKVFKMFFFRKFNVNNSDFYEKFYEKSPRFVDDFGIG